MKTESNEQQNNEMVNEGRKECILRLDDPQQYSALDAKNDESLRHDAELSESSPGAHEGSVVTTTTITALPSAHTSPPSSSPEPLSGLESIAEKAQSLSVTDSNTDNEAPPKSSNFSDNLSKSHSDIDEIGRPHQIDDSEQQPAKEDKEIEFSPPVEIENGENTSYSTIQHSPSSASSQSQEQELGGESNEWKEVRNKKSHKKAVSTR